MKTLIAVQGTAWERGLRLLMPWFDGELPIFGSDVYGNLPRAEADGFEALKKRLPGRMGRSRIGCIDLEPGTLKRMGLDGEARDVDAWRLTMLAACRCVMPRCRWGCYNEPRVQYNREKPPIEQQFLAAVNHCDITFVRVYQEPKDGDVEALVGRAIAEGRQANKAAECMPIFKSDRWAVPDFRRAALVALDKAKVETCALWFEADGDDYSVPEWLTALPRKPCRAPTNLGAPTD